MNYYTEPTKQIPIKESVDVLVLGGGPAGFATSVSSARMGTKTLLIEQSGAVGGVVAEGVTVAVSVAGGGLYSMLRNASRSPCLMRSCRASGGASIVFRLEQPIWLRISKIETALRNASCISMGAFRFGWWCCIPPPFFEVDSRTLLLNRVWPSFFQHQRPKK